MLRYEDVLNGAGIFALLLLMKQFMGFMNKEDMILDGLLDYMENTLPARKPVPDEQAQLLRYEYVLTGAGIFALLLLMKQFMGFMNKEDMILDGLLDYMENTLPARKPVPDEQALKEQTREELIDKVTEGIRQTAASETKFSHMLTPEEEHIMREVIREYLI